MENKDFDKLFRKGLEGLSEDEFPFQEEAWEQVFDTLDREKILPPTNNGGGSSTHWRRHLLWVLLLLMFTGNILMSWKFKTSQQEISMLESTITSLEDDIQVYKTNLNLNEASITFIDTTATQNTLNLPSSTSSSSPSLTPSLSPEDASVSTGTTLRLFPSISNSNFSSLSLSPSLSDRIFFNPSSALNPLTQLSLPTPSLNDRLNLTSTSNDGNVTPPLDEVTIISGQDKSNSDISSSTTQNTTTSTVNRLNTTLSYLPLSFKLLNVKPYPLSESLDSLVGTAEVKQRLTMTDALQRIAYATKPSGFEVGISGQIGYLNISNDLSRQYNGTGILGEITFGKGGTKLGFGGQYISSKIEIENISTGNYDDQLFANFPNLVPNAPNDILEKVEATFTSIEIPLYTKFLLRPDYNFTPYIGLGIIGQYHIQQTFEYYFLQAPDLISQYEIKDINGNYTQLEFNTLTTLFGVEYRKFENFNLRLGGTYRRDFSNTGLEQRQFSGFSGEFSITYQLK